MTAEAVAATRPPKSSRRSRPASVTDIGGLNDRSFNVARQQGHQAGAERSSASRPGCSSRSPTATTCPNLTTLAQQQFDLIIPVGFLMADATNTVASKLPNANFAIVDYPAALLKDKPKNVQGLLFKEQEAGYLAGYLAGLWAKDNNATTVSTVGGQKIPPVDHYIAGFQAGAKKANPQIKTLNGYSQDFVDQAKCKEIALDQIAKGSKVVFQVAGGAASARSTPPRRRACRASGWMPTRPTSVTTS